MKIAIFTQSLRRALSVAGLGLCVALGGARADSLYSVGIDTSGIAGQSGFLAFDLISGDNGIANNTVSIFSLNTDGLLSDASNVYVTDNNFFNEEVRGITFGNFLNFQFTVTENFEAPGFPDQFSFFLLDVTGLQTLVGSDDPFGADALFALDITGERQVSPLVFTSKTTNVSWGVAVPDGASTLALIAVALAGMVIVAQRRPALVRS